MLNLSFKQPQGEHPPQNMRQIGAYLQNTENFLAVRSPHEGLFHQRPEN